MEIPRQFVVFLGVPGAGKGTQVKRLEAASGLPQVSTGDLFRKHLREQTELGVWAQSFMNKGELVPDDVTIQMANERLAESDCARGALLDGYPRNLMQGDALTVLASDEGASTCAVFLDLADETCRARITGRRQCRECGEVYHLSFNPPRQGSICDACQGELYQRQDDTEQALATRILAYYKETAPLIGYFHARDTLIELPADGSPEETEDLIRVALALRLKGLCNDST